MMSILGGTVATVVLKQLLCLVGGGEGDREHTADRPGKDSRAGCTTFVPNLTNMAIRISDHRQKSIKKTTSILYSIPLLIP